MDYERKNYKTSSEVFADNNPGPKSAKLLQELNQTYLDIINLFLEGVDEPSLPKLNPEALKDVFESIMGARSDYSIKIQEMNLQLDKFQSLHNNALTTTTALEAEVAQLTKFKANLEKRYKDLKATPNTPSHQRNDSGIEESDREDGKYKKLVEVQKKLDSLRKNYDDKLNEIERLKIETDELVYKNEDMATRIQILGSQEESFKITKNVLMGEAREKETQIMMQIRSIITNFFKSSMAKTSKTSKVETQEMLDLMLGFLKFDPQDQKDIVESLKKGKWKDFIAKKLK